jgi:protease-4
MLRFIGRVFAIIGFLVTLLIVGGVVLFVHKQGKPMPEPDSVVLVLDLDQPIVEQSVPSPLDLAMHEEATPLLDILHAINKAKDDPHVKALVGRFGTEQPSLAHAQEIAAAIKAFRAKGKFTCAFGTDYGEFGLGNRAYYLGSAFEDIWLQPVGAVGLAGLAIQEPFAKTALEKIGVTADFMQREEYKSFMDMATRDDFAPPVRANMQDLLNDMGDQEAKGIAENRGWDVARVKDLMAKGPYTDEEALKAGLVTRIGYADEIDKLLQEKAGKDVKDINVATYLGFLAQHVETPAAKVALIRGTGLITERDTGPDGIAGEKIMGADTIENAFEAATENTEIKAILFRVDSPGGTPEASETIRRAMIHAQTKGKPVYVSMGETAASGGYWISMNADYIAADPGTLTGSIGVLAGKFTAGGLLQKLGINVGTIKTSDTAGMWSPTESFSPAQRERVNALLDSSYRAFVQNVSSARKIPMEKMPDIAKGRVWTGAQAIKLGLVDELGGYGTAIAAIRKKLGLAETDTILLIPFPPPETPVERVLKLLKSIGVEQSLVRSVLLQWQSVRAMLGPAWGALTNKGGLSLRAPDMTIAR